MIFLWFLDPWCGMKKKIKNLIYLIFLDPNRDNDFGSPFCCCRVQKIRNPRSEHNPYCRYKAYAAALHERPQHGYSTRGPVWPSMTLLYR